MENFSIGPTRKRRGKLSFVHSWKRERERETKSIEEASLYLTHEMKMVGQRRRIMREGGKWE